VPGELDYRAEAMARPRPHHAEGRQSPRPSSGVGDAATPQSATLVESLPWADQVVLPDGFMPAARSTRGRCACRGRAPLGAAHVRPPAYSSMVWS